MTRPSAHLRLATSRSLTDDEIVASARFPLLDRDGCGSTDYAMAVIVNKMLKDVVPMSYVIWPTGPKAMISIRPGERTGNARLMLIEAYRAAEAGILGPIVSQVPRG